VQKENQSYISMVHGKLKWLQNNVSHLNWCGYTPKPTVNNTIIDKM